MASLISLPPELLDRLTFFLSAADHVRLSLTCHHFHTYLSPTLPRSLLASPSVHLPTALAHYITDRQISALRSLLSFSFHPAFHLPPTLPTTPSHPLLLAATLRDIRPLELLLPCIPYPVSLDPLLAAASAGSVPCLRLLYDYLSARSAKPLEPAWEGHESAVRAAAKHHDGARNRALEWFLEKGMDRPLLHICLKAAMVDNRPTALRLLFDTEGVARPGWLPIAARLGNWDALEVMLEKGVPVDSRTNSTPSALFEAVVHAVWEEDGWAGWREDAEAEEEEGWLRLPQRASEHNGYSLEALNSQWFEGADQQRALVQQLRQTRTRIYNRFRELQERVGREPVEEYSWMKARRNKQEAGRICLLLIQKGASIEIARRWLHRLDYPGFVHYSGADGMRLKVYFDMLEDRTLPPWVAAGQVRQREDWRAQAAAGGARFVPCARKVRDESGTPVFPPVWLPN